MVDRVKRIHYFSCQVCGERLESPGGLYAEVAHIKPLGRPDDGPDIEQNILCLCPNHRKLLEKGGLVVEPDLTIKYLPQGNSIGRLRLVSRHKIGHDFLEWHRQRWLKA
ncbi:MAG TPA: HNH endonuclease [Dehalococcoidia bacterium]|nr:HNH endonuclease [Dehalococcoidia bacterium]